MKSFYHQGKFQPKFPEKYVGNVNQIYWRSSWERKFMVWCDLSPFVVAWTSEYPIQYLNQIDGKYHRYFVDFFVKIKDKEGKETTLMVEIKPACQINPPKKPKINNHKAMQRYLNECLTYQKNQDKWNAAKQFAKKNGFKFILLDEYDLGVKKRGK